jgi:hypothetical protein
VDRLQSLAAIASKYAGSRFPWSSIMGGFDYGRVWTTTASALLSLSSGRLGEALRVPQH